MIRNLKTLGVALAAAFAFSAVMASGAAAQEGKMTSADGGRFTLEGTEVAAGVNAFTGPFGVTVVCPESHYTGHKFNVTPHERLTSGDTKVTITPTYTNCNSGGSPRAVAMNGCDFVFHHSTTVTAPSTWSVTADIVCPVGKEITITGGACTIHIQGQTGLTGLHIKNEAKGDLRVSGTINNIKSKACGFSVTATQHQDVTISATNENGGSVGVSISD